MNADRRRLGARLALAAAVIAALLGLWHGVHGWPSATTHMRDDAWYEFTWAYNVAHGNGPVVSDGVTTSGVQYLWSLLLVPFAFGDGRLLPAIAVILGILCHLLAAATWIRAGRGSIGAWCVGLLWLGNPLLLRECQNGQETALACLCAALLWHARRARGRTFALAAFAAVLARSDLFAAVLLLSIARHRRAPWRGLPLPLAVLACTCALNKALGGGLLQDSALPMAWLRHANQAAADASAATWWRTAWWYGRPALLGGPFALAGAAGVAAACFVVARSMVSLGVRWAPLVLVALAAAVGVADLHTAAFAAVLLAWYPTRRAGARRVPLPLLAFGLGLAAVIALHWAVRWYPRDYYATVLVAFASAGLLRLRRAWPVLLAVAFYAAATAHTLPLEPLGGQLRMQLAGDFLARVVPADQRVGCANSGIVTFAQRHGGPRIVNLDGVVDARALAALQRRALGAWLDEQHIAFVLDQPQQFAIDPALPHASGRWFAPDFDPARDLVEVARFVVPGLGDALGGDAMTLFVPRGTTPKVLQPAENAVLWTQHDCVLIWRANAGDVLELEQSDGARRVLVQPGVATTAFVYVPGRERGNGRVFVRGEPQPRFLLQTRSQ